jgi:hypothetical protein
MEKFANMEAGREKNAQLQTRLRMCAEKSVTKQPD